MIPPVSFTAPLDVIASRTLDVDGLPSFHIHLGRPRLDNQPGDLGDTWLCDYVLDGPITKFRGYMGGGDAFQALLQAIYLMYSQIDTCEERISGRLTWLGQGQHFGLPSLDADPGIQEDRRRDASAKPGKLDAPAGKA